jgi:hypothetical protein
MPENDQKKSALKNRRETPQKVKYMAQKWVRTLKWNRNTKHAKPKRLHAAKNANYKVGASILWGAALQGTVVPAEIPAIIAK